MEDGWQGVISSQGTDNIINIITTYRLDYNFVINLSPYLLSTTKQMMARGSKSEDVSSNKTDK